MVRLDCHLASAGEFHKPGSIDALEREPDEFHGGRDELCFYGPWGDEHRQAVLSRGVSLDLVGRD